MPVPRVRGKGPPAQEQDQLWSRYPVPRDDGSRLHRFGRTLVCVALERVGEADFIATMPLYDAPSPAKRSAAGRGASGLIALPPFDAPTWRRMLVRHGSEYELSPAYPAIPVCVRLKEAFLLPPGADLEGWVFSRAEAQVLVSGAVLASLPLQRPHKTLYGPPDSGVVCRHDEADFLAADEPLFAAMETDPGLVAHPVRLRNASQEAILVSELCIYGEQLSILGDGTRMMSERLLFVFSSSGVRMSLDGLAASSPGWTTLARPRVSGEERFIVRSFEIFRAITRIT